MVSRSYIKEDWQKVLLVLQKYITGEGWYAFTYQYHVRLLLHFEEKLTLNFHFLSNEKYSEDESAGAAQCKEPTHKLTSLRVN